MGAILLPGGILPAEPAYAGLLQAFDRDIDARIKDLEVYAGPDVPPAGYGLETEVARDDGKLAAKVSQTQIYHYAA